MGNQRIGEIDVGEGRTKRKQKCVEETSEKKEKENFGNHFRRVASMKKAGGREKEKKLVTLNNSSLVSMMLFCQLAKKTIVREIC